MRAFIIQPAAAISISGFHWADTLLIQTLPTNHEVLTGSAGLRGERGQVKGGNQSDASQWRQTASFLPLGVPQGLRCGWAPMGGRSNRHRGADRGCTEERRCRNARVGASLCFDRAVKRASGAARAYGAPYGQPLHVPARS